MAKLMEHRRSLNLTPSTKEADPIIQVVLEEGATREAERPVVIEETIPPNNDDQLDAVRYAVQEYWGAKQEEKKAKDIITKDGTIIKQYLKDSELELLDVDGIKATLQAATKVSFNTAAMLPHIKKLAKALGKEVGGTLIKKTESVDLTALEEAIYNEKLTPEQLAALAQFQETNTTYSLIVKGPKK